jgi:ABC-2 type transport system ATP-binding protein
MTAILLEQITKRFGSHVAVNDLSLRVPAGSVFGFIGPNGSGKTTTLRMILHPAAGFGRIEVFGDPRTDIARSKIGYLPEERGSTRK